MKLKNILLLGLSFALVAALAIGGTLAYLQDDDSDVNVMTLGNVSIVQHEYQRATNEDGSYKTAIIDNQTSYVLEDFEQGKALLPIVGDPSTSGSTGWDDTTVRMSQVDSYGGMQVFAGKNAQDKFVTVENTGKTDAYIRTIVAIECGESDPSLVGKAFHSTWTCKNIGMIEIDNNKFFVYEFAYNGGQLSDGSWRHQGGILPAGDTSYPSLSQVYLKSAATNEDMVAIDGNGNGTLDILVLSQAVQAAGFENAKTALDTAFGKSSEKAAEWFGGVMADYIASLAWDGASVDTTWYDPADSTQVEYDIVTAAQLAGLAELVADGNTFEGKTLRLDKNIDLGATDDNGNPISFEPIGDANNPFMGTFDGQGYTIENIYQSGWAFGYEWGSYGSIGLFGSLDGATIKNVTIKNAEAQIEGGDVGGITGSATGDCTFENITITGTKLGTYNNGLGGIIGWSGAGEYTFKNIKIDENTVLGGLWGSFDSSIGGVVGQGEPGATYNFENVDIACRLDVYNDCTASYDYYNYRMCGMIIGRLEETTTIDGVNYPDMSKYNIICNNVTVTYGDWHNYHYCEPTPGLNGGRGMRVEAGYEYGGLPVDYDHSQCVDNHMNLIPFDQIFGGDQIAVKGLKTYDGVTVNYPN